MQLPQCQAIQNRFVFLLLELTSRLCLGGVCVFFFFPFRLISPVATKNTNATKKILEALQVITALGIRQMLDECPYVNEMDG